MTRPWATPFHRGKSGFHGGDTGGCCPRAVTEPLFLRQRQSGADPILFTIDVFAEVGVTHRRQSTGGASRCGSREVPAIDDDLRAFIGNELRHERLDLIRWQTHRARQMMLPPVHGRQHLEQMKRVAAHDLLVQLVAGDRGRHASLDAREGRLLVLDVQRPRKQREHVSRTHQRIAPLGIVAIEELESRELNRVAVHVSAI